MLKVILVIKFKNNEVKTITYEEVTDVYIDYENNKFSLIDCPTGLEYKYHFRKTGKERDCEATDILSVEIISKEA